MLINSFFSANSHKFESIPSIKYLKYSNKEANIIIGLVNSD